MPTLIKRSEPLTWSAGATRQLTVDFLPDRGPNGGFMCVDAMAISFAYDITTNASTSFEGPSFAAFIKRLRVRDADGELVNLSGSWIRGAMQIPEYGIDSPPDLADQAASKTNATGTYVWLVPFALPKARRPWDTAVPVSSLKNARAAGAGGAVEIDMASAGDIPHASSVAEGLTINSGTYTFFFYLREEMSNEVKSRLEWRMIRTAANNDHYVPVNGGWLRSLMYGLPSNANEGFASLSEMTAVHFPALGLDNITPAQLVTDYVRRSHNAQRSFTANPYTAATNACIPIITPVWDEKITQLYRYQGQVYFRTEGATTTRDLAFSVYTQRGPGSAAAQVARVGGPVHKQLKTFKGSRRGLEGWDEGLRTVLPVSLRRAG